MNADLTALQNHLNAIRERTLAWVAEDPKNRWACYPVDEASFWAEQGITTVAQFEHHNLVSSVFEATREVHGYKPSWAGLDSLSDAQLQEQFDALCTYARVQREAEEAEEAAHAKATAEALNHKSGFAIGELVPAFA